ncbi:MAG TPA: hypothetical protein VFG50_02960 [Rhodothermales bacterium]|nr:hypothetical protein [Rhodothermales bacterium]
MSRHITSFSLARKLFFAGCLSVLLAPAAFAQRNNDGSIYSRYGLGELRAFPSAQLQAMGGGGTSVLSYTYVNLTNPATWADQILTRFSAGVLYQGVQATDASNDVSRLTEGTLNAFQFSFPIGSKVGVALGYEPYSRVSYRVQRDGALPPDPVLGDTSHFILNLEGSGGLQRFVGGVGYRINRNISVGADANIIFGILEDARRTDFTGGTFRESYLSTSTRLAGVTGTLGGIVTLPQLASENDVFTVGAAFTLPATLSGSRVRTLSPNDRTPGDTLETKVPDGSVKLPWGVRAGAAYSYDQRWLLVVDGQYQPWSNFSSDFSFAGYDPGGVSTFRDRIRASAGLEFLPAGTDLVRPFLARVAYRLGAYYDRSYVSPIAGVDLHTVALTAGLGIPLFNPGTRLDLGFEIGTRGQTDQNLVRDTFYRISASVNFGERWFQRRRLR